MRHYKKKTARGETPVDVMIEAATEIFDHPGHGEYSIRKIAAKYNINYSTLSRFIKKMKQNSVNLASINVQSQESNQGSPPTNQGSSLTISGPSSSTLYPKLGYDKPRQVFTDEQEKSLCAYVKRCSEIMFGLTPAEIRQLAYKCAMNYNIKMPPNWGEKKQAGVDWFRGFMKRHGDLSVRQPEPTSLARCTAFNKTNHKRFFDKLREVLERKPLPNSRIWNMDETGVSTVMKPNKIVAQTGIKQVGAVTSAERGQMITVVVTVNGEGIFIPPMFIFPRKKYYDHFIRDGPSGSIGAANGSGWMTEETFVQYIKHFIAHTRPSADDPVLLLLDNHGSHLSCTAIDICKKHGVTLLSFPPHCSHRLQPLDVGVFAPFKKVCSTGIDAWQRSNPGKTLNIFYLPNIVKTAFKDAVTPRNILAGFGQSGIVPYNPSKFTDADFASSFVTDRPDPTESDGSPSVSESQSNVNVADNSLTDVQSTSTMSVDNSPQPSTSTFSPENVRPLPKAAPRVATSNRGRKRRETAILTDTPIKAVLEKEQQASKLRKQKKKKAPEKRTEKMSAGRKGKRNDKNNKKRVSRSLFQEESSEEEETFCLVCSGTFQKNEEWVQCTSCKMWAHWKCAKENPCYICINCESEYSTENE